MLIILGTVMKVIGIVLLSILAIILLLLALILFVPIRYGAEGQFDEKPTLKYQVKWFLPFCYLRGGYREGFYYEGKVFGFTLLSNEKKKKLQEEREKFHTCPNPKCSHIMKSREIRMMQCTKCKCG